MAGICLYSPVNDTKVYMKKLIMIIDNDHYCMFVCCVFCIPACCRIIQLMSQHRSVVIPAVTSPSLSSYHHCLHHRPHLRHHFQHHHHHVRHNHHLSIYTIFLSSPTSPPSPSSWSSSLSCSPFVMKTWYALHMKQLRARSSAIVNMWCKALLQSAKWPF